MSEKQTPRSFIIAAGLLGNLMMVSEWWGLTSTNATIIGAYSLGYAAFLALTVVVILIWNILLLYRASLFNIIDQPNAQRVLAGVFTVLGIIVIGTCLLGFRGQIDEFLSFNWTLFVLVLFYNYRATERWRYIFAVFSVLLAAFVGFLWITMTLTSKPYSPDEAIWADIARSWRLHGAMVYYSSNYLPLTIGPGLGWIHALHGEMQWLFDYDIRISRVFLLVIKMLAVVSLGLATHRLYGRFAGLAVMAIALTSGRFLKSTDYRPDHFIVFTQGLAFFFLALGWQASRMRWRVLWHCLVGLTVTLSMQLHAIGIAYAVGMSIYYSIEFVIHTLRDRKLTWRRIQPIFAFGIGAAIGTLIYYVANIMPVGGLDVYLSVLFNERATTSRRFLVYLQGWSQLETVWLFASLAYLLWHRTSTNIRYFGLLIAMAVATHVVDTQGYSIPFVGLYLIPMSALTAWGFTRKRLWVLAVMVVGLSMNMIEMSTVNSAVDILTSGRIEQFAIDHAVGELETQLSYDDTTVIVGTHELVWGFYEHPELHAIASEGIMSTQQNIEPSEVWEIIQPDIFIDMPTRAVIAPALAEYLERESFIVCQELSVAGIPMTVYRRNCDVTSN